LTRITIAGIKKTDLKRAMARLFKNKKVHAQPYGAPSRNYSKLVVGSKT
jgi:hypothetical protein